VKICGVTSARDAIACADAGADAIGFNFWPRSPRHRPLAAIAEAAAAVAGRVERFGVFVDPSVEEVEAAFAARAIDVAQLHGDEPPELVARFAGRVVKALRLDGAASLARLARWPGERLLVDAPSPGYGGSGARLDEDLARSAVRAAAAQGRKLILAGGLTDGNVAAIVARVRPWGVDVASGVERAPGEKVLERVRRFVAAAKSALPSDPR